MENKIFECAIRTNNLTKVYGGAERVSDVSMSVGRGEIYGLIGKNGAGKTTLIRMILGIATPTRGNVELNCKSSPAELSRERRKIGALIEQPAFYPTMTAYDNVKTVALSMGCFDKNKAEELLSFVGLDPKDKKKVKNFSLGMKQRLAIAVALIDDPEILFLDEPLNGLDPTGILQMREQIRKLNEERGVTVIISSHLLGELGKVATAYGIMKDGKLVREIRGEELQSMSRPHIKAVVADTAKAMQVLSQAYSPEEFSVKQNGTVEVYKSADELAAVTEILIKAGIPVLQLTVEQGDTEEAFIAIMQEDAR